MIPESFKARMRALLGSEYESFINALENESEVKGVRINRLKAKDLRQESFPEFNLTELPYAENGYIIEGSDGIGHSPLHHAGIFYMQDPGAMSSLCALDIKSGFRIFDACAAPGGKSTQAAEAISEDGFLLSNEYVPKRAKILVGNFERLGVKNAVVTSLDTSVFKSMYRAFFDLVIVDAPCSGEGMFRKSEEARREWSEDGVLISAKRQSEILDNVAPLVRDGGYLLYSTCTYSLSENEMNVDAFLQRHPDFEICEVRRELKLASSDGIAYQGSHSKNLSKTRRFYPHKSRGEGQYVALMKRSAPNERPKILFSDFSEEPRKDERLAVEEFFRRNLTSFPKGKIRKYGDRLILVSHGLPIPKGSVFSSGVLIGEIKGGVLVPSHQFYSCYGDLFIRKFELSADKEKLGEYLRGLQIELECDTNGFAVITYLGAVIGGGKVTNGRLNNHYPKGLREL